MRRGRRGALKKVKEKTPVRMAVRKAAGMAGWSRTTPVAAPAAAPSVAVGGTVSVLGPLERVRERGRTRGGGAVDDVERGGAERVVEERRGW